MGALAKRCVTLAALGNGILGAERKGKERRGPIFRGWKESGKMGILKSIPEFLFHSEYLLNCASNRLKPSRKLTLSKSLESAPTRILSSTKPTKPRIS